jgi:hypothetical protein
MAVARVKLVASYDSQSLQAPATVNLAVPAEGVASGNFLTLLGNDSSRNVSGLSVTDPKGNLWTTRHTAAWPYLSTYSPALILFDCLVQQALAPGDQVALVRSYGVGGACNVWLYEYSGLDRILAFDQAAVGTQLNGAQGAVSGGAAVNAGANGLAVGVFAWGADPGNPDQMTAGGAGYTVGGSVSINPAGTMRGVGWVSKLGGLAATEKASGTLATALAAGTSPQSNGVTVIYRDEQPLSVGVS